MSENVVLLGSYGGIAKSLARVFAARGCKLLLAGRDPDRLVSQASDLHNRYGEYPAIETLDAVDFASHENFFQRCREKLNDTITGVVLCYGDLIPQQTAQRDFAAARRSIDANFVSAVSLLEIAATYFESRKHGYIAAISSVAGDRGRQSNYLYGAAKAGLTAYMSGLRNRMFQHGTHVLTIKPGFVLTPMTSAMLNPRSLLVASADRVASDIDRAIRRRKSIVYTPWFWRPIMATICAMPEALFKRLNL